MAYTLNPITPEKLATLEGFANKPFAEQADDINRLAKEFLIRNPKWIGFAQKKDASLKDKYKDEELLREELSSYPGLKALAAHEAAHAFYKKGVEHQPNARAISEAAASLTGADIHPGADINPFVFIDHAKGVVIGETATIGQGTQIFHGVTLGAVGKSDGKDGPRHPQIGENVVLSADTQIMGAGHVHDGVLIGPASQIVKSEIGAGAVIKPGTHIENVAIEANQVLMPVGQQIFTNERSKAVPEDKQKDLDTLLSPHMVKVASITDNVMDKLRG